MDIRISSTGMVFDFIDHNLMNQTSDGMSKALGLADQDHDSVVERLQRGGRGQMRVRFTTGESDGEPGFA